MSFPAAIADQVLVACGRHCALCHVFCGLKIELHHIKQKAVGGADSFDNCIPLCFDCHADMRSYDHKHPKGRKYTEAELISHRDNWYRRYAGTGGATASPEHMELDRAVFVRLRRELSYEGVIRPLRDRYAGAPVYFKRMQPIYAFVESTGDPAFEFLDADLEGQRVALQDALAEYAENIVTHTSPSDRNAELNTFSSDRKHSDPEGYYALVHEISRLEARIVVILSGHLERRTFYGAPGYGEDPRHDEKETGFYLALTKPTCSTGGRDPELNDPRVRVRRVQLVLDSAGYARLRPLLGRHVTVRGTLFASFNGHHHAPLLLSVPRPVQASGSR